MKTTLPSRYIHSLIAALIMILGSERSHSQTILNGSFELPAITTNSFQAVQPSSWGGHAGFIFNGNSSGLAPQSGNQFVDVGNSPSFSITQSFTISTTQTYSVTWFDSAFSGGSGNATYNAAILDSSLATVVGVSLDATSHLNTWQAHSLGSLLSSGTYSFRIVPTGSGSTRDVLIDNVAIVPEPSTWAMLAAGTASLLALRRRNSKNQNQQP